MNIEIENIIGYFEKLFGITLTEFNSGDYNESLNSLNNINSLIQRIIEDEKSQKSIGLFQYRKTPSKILSSSKGRRKEIITGEKTFSSIIVTSLTEIWKKGYNAEKREVCQISFEILLDLLNYAQKRKDTFDLATTILWAFSEIVYYSKENFKYPMLRQINEFGFRWYESWVYDKISDYGKLDSINAYSKQFSSFLWFNLQDYVDSKNKEFYGSLIGSLYDGFRFYSSYFSSSVYTQILFSTDNKEIKELSEKISISSQELSTLNGINNLQIWWTNFVLNNDQLIKLIKERKRLVEFLVEIQKSYKNAWEMAIGAYFFNILKEMLSYIAGYALFIKNYQFIYEFWHYNQPTDAAAVNYGNRLLPETMKEIIDSYVKFDRFSSITDYQLSGHHEIGTYYLQYLSLLFLRQYTLTQIYTYQDFLGIDYIPNTIDNNQIDNYIDKIRELKHRINVILKNDELIKELKLYPEMIFRERPSPDEILDNLVSKLENKKEAHAIQVEINPDKVNAFKDSVIEVYNKKVFYRKILKDLLKFNIDVDITKPDSKSTAFGVNEITIKNLFAQGDEGSYFGFVERYGHEIAYQENNVLRHEIISKFNNHTETKIDKILEILSTADLTNKFIISWNIDFAYEVFLNEKEFVPKNEIKTKDENDPLISIFSGKYNDCDIYTHYDEIGWKGFMIIDKRGSGNIKQYSPGKKLREEDFIDHLLLKVDSFSQNEELLKSYLKNPPDWLKEIGSKREQETHLRKQVNIQVAESIRLTFDETFSGKSYYIRHDR